MELQLFNTVNGTNYTNATVDSVPPLPPPPDFTNNVLIQVRLEQTNRSYYNQYCFRFLGDCVLCAIPCGSDWKLDRFHYINPRPPSKITDQPYDYAFDDRWPCGHLHYDSPRDWLENYRSMDCWKHCLQSFDSPTGFRPLLVVQRTRVCVTWSVFCDPSSFEDIRCEKTREIHARTCLDFFLLVCLSSSKF